MIKRLLICVGLLSVLLLTAMSAPSAHAFDIFGGVCNGGGSGSTVCADEGSQKNCQSGQVANANCNPISGSNGLLIKITKIVAFIAGAAAVILIVVGGLRYITSGGSTEKANSARSTVINALIGLAIIVLAASLITYVVGKL